MMNINLKTDFSMLTRSQMHEAKEIAKLVMYEDSKREAERMERRMKETERILWEQEAARWNKKGEQTA